MIYLVVESSMFFEAGQIVEYVRDGVTKGMIWVTAGKNKHPVYKGNLEYIGEL